MLIVDGLERTASWLTLEDGEYRTAAGSTLVELDAATLVASIDWPRVD